MRKTTATPSLSLLARGTTRSRIIRAETFARRSKQFSSLGSSWDATATVGRAPVGIAENDFNLNIPRYVDTFAPEGQSTSPPRRSRST